MDIRNRPLPLAFCCIFSAALNLCVMMLFKLLLGTPLYLDTVFTAFMAFYGGLYPGVLTGLLTNLALNTIWFGGWGDYLYMFCNAAVAVLTVLFVRLCPAELDIWRSGVSPLRKSGRLDASINRGIALFLLAFTLCVVLSILGGLTAFCIKTFLSASKGGIGPELLFAVPLAQIPLPSLLVEIVSRIPVNMIDRIITAFCGYLLAWGIRKLP